MLVSGEYPELAEGLRQRGFCPVETLFDFRLPGPIGFHPDMQACVLREEIFVLRGGPLRDKLTALGLTVKETDACPRPEYPGDVLCNGFVWGRWLVGNPKTLDAGIQRAAAGKGLEMLPVRQGYAACSVARIGSTAAITADIGMARRLEERGFQVLRIRPGFIELPGYATGFIGGCCGKLAPDVLAVSGRLESHPDGHLMRAFIESRGVSVLELTKGPLVDVGGFVALF